MGIRTAWKQIVQYVIMKLKRCEENKVAVAAKYESSGVYVTEDLYNNVFLLDLDQYNNCRYASIYGTTYFTFNDNEIKILQMVIKKLAQLNNDKMDDDPKTLKTGNSKYNVSAVVNKVDINNMVLYSIHLNSTDTYYYFLEDNHRRIGGTFNEWTQAFQDWKDLKENFLLWLRNKNI